MKGFEPLTSQQAERVGQSVGIELGLKPFPFLYQCPYEDPSTRTTITITTTRTTHFAQLGIVLRADDSSLPIWSFPAACARTLLSIRFPSGAMRICPIAFELRYLHGLPSPMGFSEKRLAGVKGFEPLTTCLGGKCHILTRPHALDGRRFLLALNAQLYL